MSGGVSATEPESTATSSSPSTSTVISVAPIIQVDAESQTSSTFVPSSGASQTAELTKIEKPTSTPLAPSVASGTSVTNKSSKPSYVSKPTASKSTTKKSSGTNAGNNDPVFGDKQTPGGQMTTVDGDGDINKQVGIMDARP